MCVSQIYKICHVKFDQCVIYYVPHPPPAPLPPLPPSPSPESSNVAKKLNKVNKIESCHGSRLIGPPEEYLIFGSDPAVLSSSILPCIQHLRNSPRSMIFSLRYNALVISRTLYNSSVNSNLCRYCAD